MSEHDIHDTENPHPFGGRDAGSSEDTNAPGKREDQSTTSADPAQDNRVDFRTLAADAKRDYPLRRGKLATDDEWSFTALRSKGPRLAKLVNRNGDISDYDSAARFQMMKVDIANLQSLFDLLSTLQHRPDCCLVHGAIVEGTNTNYARRLMRDDMKTGERATLFDVPRRLLALDLDSVPCPDWLDPRDLEAVTRYLRKLLPEAFHGVACIGAATGSHLLKPGLRYRLFFMLDRALTGTEKRNWLKDWSKVKIDVSIFSCNQVIYTGAPIFEDISADPLPNGRLVWLDGARFVKPPSADVLKTTERRSFAQRPLQYAKAGDHSLLSLAIGEIEQAQVGDRHSAILRACGIVALSILSGELDEGTARQEIVEAAIAAGKDERETEECFDWVLEREHEKYRLTPDELRAQEGRVYDEDEFEEESGQ
ncbi:hypothetical protein [Methylocystis echinoides]|uniref:hypothetical protein n=1 Tax=Methylocystis echinoides TaxID=29468 RepID=UPI003412A174